MQKILLLCLSTVLVCANIRTPSYYWNYSCVIFWYAIVSVLCWSHIYSIWLVSFWQILSVLVFDSSQCSDHQFQYSVLVLPCGCHRSDERWILIFREVFQNQIFPLGIRENLGKLGIFMIFSVNFGRWIIGISLQNTSIWNVIDIWQSVDKHSHQTFEFCLNSSRWDWRC